MLAAQKLSKVRAKVGIEFGNTEEIHDLDKLGMVVGAKAILWTVKEWTSWR